MDAGDHIHIGAVWNAPALGTKSLTVWPRHIWVSTKHANHIRLERPFSRYASLQQPTNCFASFQTFLPRSIATVSTSARSTSLSLSTDHPTTCDNSWKVSKRAKRAKKGPRHFKSIRSGMPTRYVAGVADRRPDVASRMLLGLSINLSSPMTPALTSTPCARERRPSTTRTMSRSMTRISTLP